MNRSNILYICRYAANYSGNFIPSISSLGCRLSALHNVYYLFPEAARGKPWVSELPVPAEQIFFCEFTPMKLFLFCRDIALRFKHRKTFVHTHFMGGPALLTVNLCFRNRMNHYHMFVPPADGFKEKVRRFIARINYRGSIVIGVSDTQDSALRAYLPGSIIETVPNGIDFEHLTAASLTSARPEYMENGTFNILMHGSHFYWKGVDFAARVVEQLNLHGKHCNLYITCGDIEFTESQLHAVVTHPEYFRVIKGVEDVKNLYDNADLMLSASRFDAFGYAIVEAAYSECQIVATDIPGPNMLKDIPGIHWIESENEMDLANAILEVMEAKRNGSAAAVKQKQKEYVASRYNTDIWTERVLKLYHKHFGITT